MSFNNWKRRDLRQLLATIKERWQGQPYTPRAGAVYIIKIGTAYKIGCSVNAELRIKAMQLPQQPDVARIFRTPLYTQCQELEKALHEKYAPQRRYGEWFELADSDLAEIDRFCEDWLKRRQ